MNCQFSSAVRLALCGFLLWPSRVPAEDERVLYAPDIVGAGRMFMVALKVPMEASEVEVTAPQSVTLFDRTPLPAKSETRKYYFRSVKPVAKTEIRFALPSKLLSLRS